MLFCLQIFGKEEIYRCESVAVILCLGYGLSITGREDLEVLCLCLMLSVLPRPTGVKPWGADSPGHGNEVWGSAEVSENLRSALQGPHVELVVDFIPLSPRAAGAVMLLLHTL